MPTPVRIVSAYVAGAVLGIFLIAFGLFSLIFWFPRDIRIMGMGNVNVRQIYTRYACADIAEILDSRNIMINSRTTDIQIRAANPGQGDEGTLLLFENARGITFNEWNRTHVSWGMELADCGKAFYSITVHEPNGAIQRQAYLLISIVSDGSGSPFNFVFNTGTANVSFQGDSPADVLNVESIVINHGSVGIFDFPPPATIHPFEMSIERLTINSSPATVRARSPVTENVTINSRLGNFNFGEIGTQAAVLPTLVVTNSTSVSVTAGQIEGDVYFRSGGGSLSSSGVGGSIKFNSATAQLRPSTVGGDLYATTSTGSIVATRVYGNVDFTTGVSGSISVTEIRGDLTATSTAGGSISSVSVWGESDINVVRASVTLGTGSGPGITAGVRGDTTIRNIYGPTSVSFMVGLPNEPELYIRGFDGNITVRNIVGPTEIIVGLPERVGGRAIVDAGFRAIASGPTGTNRIYHMGSTNPNTSHGNITIRLQGFVTTLPYFQPFTLSVANSRDAFDRTGWDTLDSQSNIRPGSVNPGVSITPITAPGGEPWLVQQGSASHILEVNTTNRVFIYRSA